MIRSEVAQTMPSTRTYEDIEKFEVVRTISVKIPFEEKERSGNVQGRSSTLKCARHVFHSEMRTAYLPYFDVQGKSSVLKCARHVFHADTG